MNITEQFGRTLQNAACFKGQTDNVKLHVWSIFNTKALNWISLINLDTLNYTLHAVRTYLQSVKMHSYGTKKMNVAFISTSITLFFSILSLSFSSARCKVSVLKEVISFGISSCSSCCILHQKELYTDTDPSQRVWKWSRNCTEFWKCT